MSIRRDPIYISSDVWGWLRLLSKAQATPEEGRIVTPDEIADKILREVILEKHPQLAEYQKTHEQMIKQLLKTL